MPKNRSLRSHVHANYPLDASIPAPDLEAHYNACNEPTRLHMIAEEYWKVFKRPPPVYAKALNPGLDRVIEECGRPPKADAIVEESDRTRGRGAGALAATYAEIIIHRYQGRNGVANANYETSIHEHQKFVAGVHGATGGLF